MDAFVSLVVGLAPIALLGLAFYWLLVRPYRRSLGAKTNEIQVWYDENVSKAKNPASDIAFLRSLLAMENPHDDMFFARLSVLRALSQNPSLPVELQAAAINRVSQEESAARLDKSLRAMSKKSGGSKGFVGFTTEM